MWHYQKFFARNASKILLALTVVGLIPTLHFLKYASKYPPLDASESNLFSGNKAENSPELIVWLRQKIIRPPSKLPYNLKHKNREMHEGHGHVEVIQLLLDDMRNGTYVECGGFDGEHLSNTLYFEKYRGWRGLLIEPDDNNFANLVTKNRKAFVANACISETNKTTYEAFNNHLSAGSGLVNNAELVDKMMLFRHEFQVTKCLPFHSYMLALRWHTVDYFSLDVEGSELKILHHIPWETINIRTMSVEYMLHEHPEEIVTLLESKDYVHFMTLNAIETHDYIFIKKDILSSKWLGYKLPVLIEGVEMLHNFINGSLH